MTFRCHRYLQASSHHIHPSDGLQRYTSGSARHSSFCRVKTRATQLSVSLTTLGLHQRLLPSLTQSLALTNKEMVTLRRLSHDSLWSAGNLRLSLQPGWCCQCILTTAQVKMPAVNCSRAGRACLLMSKRSCYSCCELRSPSLGFATNSLRLFTHALLSIDLLSQVTTRLHSLRYRSQPTY